MDAGLYSRLFRHLFPGDHDEHGAVVTAGLAVSDRGTRLLARDLFLAEDGVNYVPGTRGYRALTPEFVAQRIGYCADQNLCYLAIHCHHGDASVGFSRDDMASHERGYPALLDITSGGPVGALVFAQNAIAGDIWTPTGRFALHSARVIGPTIRSLYPSSKERPPAVSAIFDRQARLFGDLGQSILSGLKVGIIGLGGGGSLINEWLARLGIGHILAVDFDRVEVSNLPRIVGANSRDLASSKPKRFGRPKVRVAERVAREANPEIRYDAIVGDVLDEKTARLLSDCDFLFLASDTIQSRLVFNALVHQYSIPGIQIGAKVTVAGGRVDEIFTATRPVLPGKPCMDCYGLIPAGRLREESLTHEELRRQRYVEADEVVQPSVITLNVLSAAQAVNDLLLMFTGLFRDGVELNHQLAFVRERSIQTVTEIAQNPSCLDCSGIPKSRRARGDRVRLPCRAPGPRSVLRS
jgi:hypothetical protein